MTLVQPLDPRPLVVAQCPGGPTAPPTPLEGSPSGRRLVRLCGLRSFEELAGSVELVNLLEENPGPVWDLVGARTRALDLLVRYGHKPRVVLLGSAVRDAFAHWDASVALPWFTWSRILGVWWACSPHPSGLSRVWNDPAKMKQGEVFWRSVVQ